MVSDLPTKPDNPAADASGEGEIERLRLEISRLHLVTERQTRDLAALVRLAESRLLSARLRALLAPIFQVREQLNRTPPRAAMAAIRRRIREAARWVAPKGVRGTGTRARRAATEKIAKVGRAAHVLRREGPAGVIGRLRFAERPPPPRPPLIVRSVTIVGDTSLSRLVAKHLRSSGVRVEAGKPDEEARSRGTRWIFDVAGLSPANLTAQDVLFAGEDYPVDQLAVAWDRVGLVVEHDDHRIRNIARRQRGRPHVMVIPPPPAEDAGEDAWTAYALRSQLAMQRVLLFCEAIPADRIDISAAVSHAAEPPARQILPGPALRLALSLPEFPDRRVALMSQSWHDLRAIDGLRQTPGWRGAGSTYRLLAQAALARGEDAMLVCQDDAEAGPDFARRYPVALDYWWASGAAMFAGLVTDVDDSIEIRRVEQRDGVTFLHLNRSVGLVFNIFGKAMLQRMSAWDEADRDPANTMDRYISRTGNIEVITCLPYLVRHRGGHGSTIWNFDNGRYDSIIRASERRLARMAGIALPAVAN